MQTDAGELVGPAWFVLSLITAGIAQGKGSGGLGWFIGSLFFGPLALLFLLFTENKENPNRR